MSGHAHPIWKLLDKLQMDNRAQAARLVELRALVAALELPDGGRQHHHYDKPADSPAYIRRLIANGAIRDDVDLDVELRSGDHHLSEAQIGELRALLS